jgi:hypothetical protein
MAYFKISQHMPVRADKNFRKSKGEQPVPQLKLMLDNNKYKSGVLLLELSIMVSSISKTPDLYLSELTCLVTIL